MRFTLTPAADAALQAFSVGSVSSNCSRRPPRSLELTKQQQQLSSGMPEKDDAASPKTPAPRTVTPIDQTGAMYSSPADRGGSELDVLAKIDSDESALANLAAGLPDFDSLLPAC